MLCRPDSARRAPRNSANEGADNGVQHNKIRQNKHAALLQGLLRCSCCGAEMAHTSTAPRGRRYHYYVCRGNRIESDKPCAEQRVSASALEESVLQQIEILANDRDLEGVRQVRDALGPKWRSRNTEEQRRLLGNLVERITYEGANGRVTVRLRQAEKKHV